MMLDALDMVRQGRSDDLPDDICSPLRSKTTAWQSQRDGELFLRLYSCKRG